MVKDPAQALVPGSLVTLTNQQTAVASTVFTNDQGAYRFPSVLPGTYVVKAEAKGFQASVSSYTEGGCRPDRQVRFNSSDC